MNPKTDDQEQVRNDVKSYYRDAALQHNNSDGCCADQAACRDTTGRWGASQYDDATLADGSQAAAALSMGCGNPHAMADLVAGETVLDLGSGGGLDVILSAKRVGPTGKAYGVDFLPEMLDIARLNAADAQVENAEFLEGDIADLPLSDETIDVVISNCVINLAPNKTPVFAELARVLRTGGRAALADVVADNDAPIITGDAAWAECAVGALPYDDYLAALRAAGLADVTIGYTHDVGPGLHGAIIRAVKP